MKIVSSSAHEHFNDGHRRSSRSGLPVQAVRRQPNVAPPSKQAGQQEQRASSAVSTAHEFFGQAYRAGHDLRAVRAINAYQAQDVADQRAALSCMLGIDVYA